MKTIEMLLSNDELQNAIELYLEANYPELATPESVEEVWQLYDSVSGDKHVGVNVPDVVEYWVNSQ